MSTVVTFYSFKGGVGRTQALASVAAELTRRGKSVIAVDMDLESPGLFSYFNATHLGTKPGLIDYLDAWRTTDTPPNIDNYLVDLQADGQRIRALGPGTLDHDYSRRVSALGWEQFYEEGGDLVMERLREELTSRAEFVLIDSRTGLTDVGTICTFHLPDILVALFALHQQGLDGTRLVAHAIADRISGDPALPTDSQRLKRVLLVPARVDENDGAKVSEWLTRAREAFSDLPEQISLPVGSDGATLRLPYDRDMAYGEHLAFGYETDSRLAQMHRGLTDHILGSATTLAAHAGSPPTVVLIEGFAGQEDLDAIRSSIMAAVPDVDLRDTWKDVRWELGLVVLPTGVTPDARLLEQLRDSGLPLVHVTTGADWISGFHCVDPGGLPQVVRALLGRGTSALDATVFLSYHAADLSVDVKALEAALATRGVRTWNVLHGANGPWRPEMARQLHRATAVVVVDTPAARTSTEMAREALTARSAGIPLLFLPPVSGARIPTPEFADAVRMAQDAIVEQASGLAQRARARRYGFASRAEWILERTAVRLGWSGGSHLVRGHGKRLLVEALERTPEGEDVLAVGERARAVGATHALLVGGERPYTGATRKIHELLKDASGVPVTTCPLSLAAVHLEELATGAMLPRVLLSAALPERHAPSEPALENEQFYSLISRLTAAVVLGGGSLVFGGHPTITPVVHRVLVDGDLPARVELHQLARFRDTAPPQVQDSRVFPTVHWHGQASDPLPTFDGISADLGVMRDAMVRSVDAAIFVGGRRNGLGGKPGIVDEFERLRAATPHARVHLVELFGGATEDLCRAVDGGDPAIRVHTTRDVDALVNALVTDLLAPATHPGTSAA